MKRKLSGFFSFIFEIFFYHITLTDNSLSLKYHHILKKNSTITCYTQRINTDAHQNPKMGSQCSSLTSVFCR